MLGALLSHVSDADFFSNDRDFIAGLAEGGVVALPVAPDEFPRGDAIITYRVPPKRDREQSDLHIPDITTLKRFIEASVTVLGERWSTRMEQDMDS